MTEPRFSPGELRAPALTLSAALLAACVTAGAPAPAARPVPASTPPSVRAVAEPCAAGPELAASWLEPGGVVLFGDWHGTAELPAFFGEVVCRAAAAGRPILVGLELPRDEQAALERLLAAPDPGNFHARITIGAPWDPAARPMGWYLRQAGLRVRSLNCAGPVGTSWSCTGPDAASCGVQAVDLGGRPGAGPSIELLELESAAGFAGRFLVPSLTASPPAALGVR